MAAFSIYIMILLAIAAVIILISIVRYNKHLDKVTRGEVHDTHSSIPEPRTAAGISYKVVLMIVLIMTFIGVSTVSGIVATMQNRINNLDSDMDILQNQLYNLQLSINDQASHIEYFTFNVGDLNSSDNTATVETEVLLREYAGETTVQLVVDDIVYELADKGNGLFSADIVRGLFDNGYDTKLVIKEPGRNYTEMVDFPGCLVYDFLPMPSYECSFTLDERLGKTYVTGYYNPLVYNNEDVESVTVTYLSDGEEFETFDITKETLNRETIDVDRTIANGADFTIRMEIVTKSGFKIVEQTLMVYSHPEDYDDYEFLRVYDINGNLLWEDDYR